MLNRIIRFSLENKLVVFLALGLILGWGVLVAPFDWNLGSLPRNPVPVDAIPDIGENQQIVFTDWAGRSPQDVEDQITYPLTVALLGIPGVKTIRSYSFFGFSTVYVIFNEDIEFYWSRSRLLEKLNSLPSGTLPKGVTARLGPDATALGQVFWYTLEGRDQEGNPAAGWGLDELRSIQDWTVRYALQSAEGVAEVASIGGYVKEYQVDADPDLLRHYDVTLAQLIQAVKMSNLDIGARTIEVNKTEQVIRAVGFIKDISDLEQAVVAVRNNVPVLVDHVANVSLGPALRRGALDKEGAEAVGGVAVVRYGENPLATIKNVKEKIREISSSLPQKELADGTTSKVTIVPFYDRTGLIYETLDTLETALTEEILVTVIVVIVMVMHFTSAILVSILLPIAVLMTFIAMKAFGVDANIVALSGIAIAIGTMVDMAIVLSENMLKHMAEAPPEKKSIDVIFDAASEVGSAVLTSVMTTVVSFLPVFTLVAAEGKLFSPLAYTKTFALIAALIVALLLIPPLAHILLGSRSRNRRLDQILNALIGSCGIGLGLATGWWWPATALILWGLYRGVKHYLPDWSGRVSATIVNIVAVVIVTIVLATHWMPLGHSEGTIVNTLFVAGVIGSLLLIFYLFQLAYPYILSWALRHKFVFLTFPVMLMVLAATIWLGFNNVFAFIPGVKYDVKPGEEMPERAAWVEKFDKTFPKLDKEFMPALDEGSYLLMPTTMPHASIGEALDILSKQDMAIRGIPEVDMVVGKIGRADSPLDPAPISMVETVITYKSEFRTDEDGNRVRQWRDHINSPSDIWKEIQEAAELPGSTTAPKLQPIAARIVMLQSGMRAPMGVKVRGADLETIERVGLRLERLIKEVDGVKAGAVNADRIVGKPYLEIIPNGKEIARYGLHKTSVMEVIQTGIGGMAITGTVEGRERYPVRVRYSRELRDSLEALGRVMIAAPDGTQVPLEQLSDFRYVRGPQVIKSEDTFLVGYVTFDKLDGFGEIDVVENAVAYLDYQETVFAQALGHATDEAAKEGRELSTAEINDLPGLNLEGTSYVFAGNYENQIRSEKTLMVVLPLALVLIFIILYLQFRSVATTFMVFSGIAVATTGGFILLWLYGQSWFLDATFGDINLRELFQVRPINLSVAVWVGFIALFGIATDDGVVIATYLKQTFDKRPTETVEGVRAATLEAGKRRVRPCLMTTATTLLALLPVLTSTGRGSDIMVPMALPAFGGMSLELLTMFVVPVLYAMVEEAKVKARAVASQLAAAEEDSHA
jgi:copper/silver efflux system protein